jgi:hypothetical protein
MPDVTRYARTRFLAAGVTSALFGWLVFLGLMGVAAWSGVITSFEHRPAIRQWIQIGESWQEILVTLELTDAGSIIAIFAVVVSYYMARITCNLDIAILHRRARWLIAGWFLGCLLAIVQTQLVTRVYGSIPFLAEWPNLSASALGVLLPGLTSGSVKFWSWVMKVFKVPHATSG